MDSEFDVLIERDEDGLYLASVADRPGCHAQARSLDELMSRVREAIELTVDRSGEPAETLEVVAVERVISER